MIRNIIFFLAIITMFIIGFVSAKIYATNNIQPDDFTLQMRNLRSE